MPVFFGRTIKTPSWAKTKSPSLPTPKGTSQSEIDAFLGKPASTASNSPISKGTSSSSSSFAKTPPSSAGHSSQNSLPYPIAKPVSPLRGNGESQEGLMLRNHFDKIQENPGRPVFQDTPLGQNLQRQYYASNGTHAHQRPEIDTIHHPIAQRSTKKPISGMEREASGTPDNELPKPLDLFPKDFHKPQPAVYGSGAPRPDLAPPVPPKMPVTRAEQQNAELFF